MSKRHWNRHSVLTRFCALGTVILAFVAIAGSACDMGGKEGDRCNPLVLRDECNTGLHCKAATCSESYCCPINGSSGDPHCNAEGCPDTDAGTPSGSDAGEDAGDTGSAG